MTDMTQPSPKPLTKAQLQQQEADRRVSRADYIISHWMRRSLSISSYLRDPKMPPSDVDDILEGLDR